MLGPSSEKQIGADPSPRVDVIVPTYNYAQYLDACLASVQNQSFLDYSVLIMDNASEDATEAIARRWEERDSRFHYERNESNLGLKGSLLKAYAMTRGELICILSADDLLEPHFLEKTVTALHARPECSFAYSAWKMFADTRDSRIPAQDAPSYCPHPQSGPYNDAALLLAHNWITNSFTLFRRSVCDSVGGINPDGLQHVGDWYMWMRFLARGPAYYVDETLGRYRLHAHSETNRLVTSYQSGFDHLRFYDLILANELFPMAIRLAAKVHQIRWLTGEPLTVIARKMGGEASEPLMKHYWAEYREAVYVAIAQSVLQYAPSRNFLDTPENAIQLLLDAVTANPNNAQAVDLLRSYRSYRRESRPRGLRIS